VLRRVTGACCESWRATDGGRCAGGWDSEELILPNWELDDWYGEMQTEQFVDLRSVEAGEVECCSRELPQMKLR
jgi:hypothetical protein